MQVLNSILDLGTPLAGEVVAELVRKTNIIKYLGLILASVPILAAKLDGATGGHGRLWMPRALLPATRRPSFLAYDAS